MEDASLYPPTRTPLAISEIATLPNLSCILVISWQGEDGTHYAPCLRQSTTRRDVLKVTVYHPTTGVTHLKLTWLGHGVFVDGTGNTRYYITQPVGRELESCRRVLGRFESEMGEDGDE